MGFLFIQLYWAKNTVEQRKENLFRVYEICIEDIAQQLNLTVLNKSAPVNPNVNNKITTFKSLEKSYEEELSKKIFEELIAIKNKPLAYKRKQILKTINSHYALSINYNIETLLKEKEITKIIEDSFNDHGIENEFQFTITDQKGVLIFTNFKNIAEENLNRYSMFSVDFLEDEVGSQKSILTLYVKGLKRSILKSISNVLIISIVLIVIILGAFILSINIIKSQKRTTRVKTDFINNMTHELKTPIATIGLACEALIDTDIELNPSSKKKFLKTIQNENERLGQLVENVLENSLSDKGNPQLKLEIFNVEDVIIRAIKSIQLSFSNKDGTISTDFMALNKLVEADKFHLTNVFNNLLDNSLKYTTKKPEVTISTRDVIGGLVIRIKDNGIGIAKENQIQVFEKLFRVPTGDLHNVKGFGLGLSYVKSILELHKGAIKVESKVGEGSTFLITLKSSKIIQQ